MKTIATKSVRANAVRSNDLLIVRGNKYRVLSVVLRKDLTPKCVEMTIVQEMVALEPVFSPEVVVFPWFSREVVEREVEVAEEPESPTPTATGPEDPPEAPIRVPEPPVVEEPKVAAMPPASVRRVIESNADRLCRHFTDMIRRLFF